jgi:hypothetical protein
MLDEQQTARDLDLVARAVSPSCVAFDVKTWGFFVRRFYSF